MTISVVIWGNGHSYSKMQGIWLSWQSRLCLMRYPLAHRNSSSARNETLEKFVFLVSLFMQVDSGHHTLCIQKCNWTWPWILTIRVIAEQIQNWYTKINRLILMKHCVCQDNKDSNLWSRVHCCEARTSGSLIYQNCLVASTIRMIFIVAHIIYRL